MRKNIDSEMHGIIAWLRENLTSFSQPRTAFAFCCDATASRDEYYTFGYKVEDFILSDFQDAGGIHFVDILPNGR